MGKEDKYQHLVLGSQGSEVNILTGMGPQQGWWECHHHPLGASQARSVFMRVISVEGLTLLSS